MCGVEDLRRQLRERQEALSNKLRDQDLSFYERLKGVGYLDTLESLIKIIDETVPIQPSHHQPISAASRRDVNNTRP